MNRCWREAKYICPDEASIAPLDSAIKIFNTGKWEYMPLGHGGDTNNNSYWETDCKFLVDTGLEVSGFHRTGTFFGSVIQQMVGWPWMDPEYFCQIDVSQAGPGDIVVFSVYWDTFRAASHIAFISAPMRLEANGSYSSELFEATRCPSENDLLPGVKLGRKWNSQEGYACETNGTTYRVELWRVYRPKKKVFFEKCRTPRNPPDHALYQYHGDPLMLDLDGGGIRTVGLDAGVHFDHDNNGFKELTGWVAPGDGMLMLDKNGNGLLDDGSELFGDSTILPDGIKASNGFHALAYYDVNHDGKIDANDPIWRQLRVWQPSEEGLFLEAGG